MERLKPKFEFPPETGCIKKIVFLNICRIEIFIATQITLNDLTKKVSYINLDKRKILMVNL